MKQYKVWFYLFVISIIISSLLMIIFMTNIYSKTNEINNNIDEMNKYVQQIGKIDDDYNLLLENIEKEKTINLENEQYKKEIEQIEQEIIDYQEKIDSIK